ncbi:MAG: four helix bundle protein [Patescibacteria group bacterium]|nr:four helix bundle protein [Patescibacteria group bacterium]MDD3435313.1 four helix bundle protein [Patescibacteria group bacterium]
MNQPSLHTSNSTPPRQFQLAPLLQKSKDSYLLWHTYFKLIPKEHRFSLGVKIDNIFIEIIEMISGALYIKKEERALYIKVAIRKTDTLKLFFLILWETKPLDNKKYLAISEKIDEIGRMLGGWLGQTTKQNSSIKR